MGTKKPRKFLIFFLFFIAVCIAVAVVFHEVVVYTSNAYIRANWAAVSPRVKGHVKAVHVQNNARVKKGELMIELEEYPYRLVLNVHKATLAQDQAQLKVTEVKYEMARETLKSVTAEFKLAVKKRDRFKELVREKAVSRQVYENVETELDNTTIRLTQAKENVKYWMAAVAEQATVIDASRARVALAEYDLSMCRICAPNPGFVNNMYIRPGDYARGGTAHVRRCGEHRILGGGQLQGKLCGENQTGTKSVDTMRPLPIPYFPRPSRQYRDRRQAKRETRGGASLHFTHH